MARYLGVIDRCVRDANSILSVYRVYQAEEAQVDKAVFQNFAQFEDM